MSPSHASEPPVKRIDRILAFASLGIVLLSVAAFITTIVGTIAGVTDFATGVWPTVFAIQMVGPIVALVLILTLLIISLVRRGRASRGA